ncbi:YhzD family protein [Bacillus fonticola]|uniref:YhzD family protein n=1 Tax=Bacillus fonticola TaxID=2728853 RepID=UPI001472FD80|nr:YhzD family protein [Bacillus fonticola]
MKQYTLTAFDAKGTKLLDEKFEAASDDEAKQIGTDKLTEKDALHTTHRLVNSVGKLLLFRP